MTTTAATRTEEAIPRRPATVAKVVELIGISDKGWEDAAQAAIDEAKKTIHNIHGIKIHGMTADIDPTSGRIVRYKTCIKLSFGVIGEER
ncbi:MAG TPA: dodecin family protein [Nitrososphaera sp.]|jgi:flavin-binding protein dodecin